MTVLVTGAAGFIGRRVVEALARRGVAVRALVRSAQAAPPAEWPQSVEVVRGDLLGDADLDAALDGVETVVHLAAKVLGTDEQRFAAAVAGTERLVGAFDGTGVRRLVLASSYAVYDWSRVDGSLDEQAPTVEAGLYERDGYTVAKVWQERVARRASAEGGFELTVLRPGFVWGRGGEWVGGAGERIGTLHVVIGPLARLPLTYVDNCADCFAVAATHPAAGGRTFNVVDEDLPSAWRYAAEYARGTAAGGIRVPVPYAVAMAGVRALYAGMQRIAGGRARLPGMAVPCRFEARFKPLRHGAGDVRTVLGWRPPVPFDEALRRTFG